MNILFLSREYPPETGWGGIGTYVGCMAPVLAARGHEVHVLSCVSGQAASDTIDRGVHVHRRNQLRVRGWEHLALACRVPQASERIRTALSTFTAVRQLRTAFDVIEYPDYGAEGWLFALLGDRRTVCYLHGPLFAPSSIRTGERSTTDSRVAATIEHFAVRRARAVTAPSSALVAQLKDHGWLQECAIALVPCPIDVHAWTGASPVMESPPLALFMGRLEENKAPEVLVEAMAMIRQELPEATALFLGQNSGRREGMTYLEWLVRKAGKGGGCQFVGRRPRAELLSYISRSRAVVVPSLRENYSFVAIEGMAAGRPVVLTTTNGVAELVQDTGAGAVVPPGDPKALAAALLPYLRDVTHAAHIGDRARAAVLARHDPERSAVLREQVYGQIVSRRHASPARCAGDLGVDGHIGPT